MNQEKIVDVSVAIMAGGRSKRFGSQKLYAIFEGKSLIDNAVEIALRISHDIFLITGDGNNILNEDWPSYPDLISGCGPMGGIHTALAKSKNNWVAIMPADMPLLIPEIYFILNNYRDLEVPIVACSSSGIEPLVSLWPVSAIADIEFSLQKREYKLQTFLDNSMSKKVTVMDLNKSIKQKNFHNVNTTSDL